MLTKLPIKQYQTYTTLEIHVENNLTMILARSWQDLGKIFQVQEIWQDSPMWEIGGTHPRSPTSPKVRNRIE